MVMAIENLTPEQILKRELATGEPVIYRLAADGSLENTLAA
jgi:2,3-bisphosphoglycerate-dependent phosphoglycerate mutase